jgi:hypothetical protein
MLPPFVQSHGGQEQDGLRDFVRGAGNGHIYLGCPIGMTPAAPCGLMLESAPGTGDADFA